MHIHNSKYVFVFLYSLACNNGLILMKFSLKIPHPKSTITTNARHGKAILILILLRLLVPQKNLNNNNYNDVSNIIIIVIS